MSEVTLKYPIKINGVEVKTLTFRRVTAGDRIRGTETCRGITNEAELGLKLMRFLACATNQEGLTPDSFDQLDAEDHDSVVLAVSGQNPT